MRLSKRCCAEIGHHVYDGTYLKTNLRERLQRLYEDHPCREIPIRPRSARRTASVNNLNVRMHDRRTTRLTNAFSKKVQNHAHSMALLFLYYNFVRIHQTLKMTPAMAAGVTKRLWKMTDVVDMLEAWEATQ
jgi:hypothetical protein